MTVKMLETQRLCAMSKKTKINCLWSFINASFNYATSTRTQKTHIFTSFFFLILIKVVHCFTRENFLFHLRKCIELNNLAIVNRASRNKIMGIISIKNCKN